MVASVSSPQVDHHSTHQPIYGFTNVQRVFILAATVVVVAAAVFALQTLGIPQAIAVGTSLGLVTMIALSEFIRVRMVKLSQLKTYKHSEWALFPSGMFSHANIMRRPRVLVKKHHDPKPATPPTVTLNEAPVKSETPTPVKKHRSTHKKPRPTSVEVTAN